MLCWTLFSSKRLVGNAKLKGNLGCNDRGVVEFKIIWAVKRVCRKFTTLDFRRVAFGVFSDLLDLLWDKALEEREAQESWLILTDHFLQAHERCIPTIRKLGKTTGRPA